MVNCEVTAPIALEAILRLRPEIATLDSRLPNGYDTKVYKANENVEVPLLDTAPYDLPLPRSLKISQTVGAETLSYIAADFNRVAESNHEDKQERLRAAHIFGYIESQQDCLSLGVST